MITKHSHEKPKVVLRVVMASAIALASSSAGAATDGPAAEPGTDTAATHFAQTCSGCHTLGSGVSRGPDLMHVAAWPDAQLSQSIKAMERKVGPLSTEQIDALVQLLKDTQVQERLTKARAKFTQSAMNSTQPPDSLVGGALFFGRIGLQNGGLPCSSCHRFRGEGGDLAPDLSGFAEHSQIDALASTIARASFPVMRAAYAPHPITSQEARHLASFMKQAKAQRRTPALRTTVAFGLGGGLATFALVLVAIMSRPKGVRARLIQRATKR